jgi:N-acetylneuraminic acid mutarotase
MIRRPPLTSALMLTLFGVLSCGEDTPTQPGTPDVHISAATAAATASNTWTAEAPRPGTLGNLFTAGVAPNSAGQSIFYTFGGVGDEGFSRYPVQAYNVATNTWSTKTSVVQVYDLNGVAKIGNKLYFSGGRSHDGTGETPSVPTTWAYDYTHDALTRLADMPKATSEGVTGVIDGKMYVLPGFCEGNGWPSPGYCDHSAIRQLFRYDPVANKWGARRSCPHYHPYGAGGVINGKFYVAGGAGTNALDAFDPATDSWQTLAPIPTAGRSVGAVIGPKIYVLVGFGSTGQAYVYDSGTNTWKSRAPYPGGIAPSAAAKVTLNGIGYLLAIDPQSTQLYTR